MKTKNLHWNVLGHDFNKDEIVNYDIFSHVGFVADLKAADRKFKDNAEFLDEVDRSLQYYFWAKAEHEILVKGLFGNNQIKLDAYAQINANWNQFAEYLLTHR